jgi:hypothetical protein
MRGNLGMTRTSRGVSLVALSAVVSAGAAFVMQPCPPLEAIIGAALGCGVGVLVGVRETTRPDEVEVPRMRAVVTWLPIYVLLWLAVVATSRLRRPLGVPDWLLPVGRFFSGGAWLSFALVPFTAGICMVFYARGKGSDRAGAPGRSEPVSSSRN